ncbi:MAG: ABC transporter permease subunit [Fusobacterium sp. JB019]|nr:ABC transporter permease subunit [Fusobacterium sp. JB020]MDP0506063.1 ABC transporter permease subunit [Fusobacterium sp. JB019]
MINSIMKNKEKIYTVLSILSLLIIWKVLAVVINKSIIVPSPEETFRELVSIIKSPYFIVTVLGTIKRVLLGFFISFMLAMTLSLLAGFNNVIYYLLKPVVTIIKVIPTMGVILLALIWLKSRYATIFVGFLIIFPILYENNLKGIKSVDKNLLEMSKIYEISSFDLIKDIYIPSMKPFILAGINNALSINLKIIIAAEVLSELPNSIGSFLQIEKTALNTPGVFAWCLVALIIGGSFEIILSNITKRF